MRSAIAIIAVCWLSPAAAGPYNDAGPAVIQIHIEGTLKSLPDGAKTKFYQDDATGFVVSPDGMVMTAGHVVPDANAFEEDTLSIEGRFPHEVALNTPSGGHGLVANDPAFQLRIVKSTRTPHDAGLFKIENVKQPLRFLRLCDEYSIEEKLTLLGYFGGARTLAIRRGDVSTPAIGPSPMVMQIPMHKGDSGGPILNAKGTVIAIGIGQLKFDGERVESSNLAVMIRNAISAMSPEAKALIGISYDPWCDKKLADPAASNVEQIDASQSTGITLDWGQSKTLTQTFQAPTGKVFSEIVFADAKSDSKLVAAKTAHSSITNEGKTLQMTVEANAEERGGKAPGEGDGGGEIFKSVLKSIDELFGGKYLAHPSKKLSASVDGKIIATVKPLPNEAVVASDRREPQLRSFLVSRTLQIHTSSATRQNYSDRIPAPEGYRFQRIVDVKVASANHSPSNGLEAAVSGDGEFLQAAYSLESGPLENPWKAWIDAFVTASLVPVGAR